MSARTARAFCMAVVLATTAVMLLATPAIASTSEITSAVASTDWTHGSVTGSVTWDQCPEDCQWTAFAYVEPSLPEYHCGSEDLFSSDPNVRQVWNSGAQATNGTANFSVTDTLILPGVYGQKACLLVVYHRSYVDPLCRAQVEVIEHFNENFLGHPPYNPPLWEEECPPTDHTLFESRGSRIFTVEQVPPPPTTPAPVIPPAVPIAVPAIQPPPLVTTPKPLTRAQKLAKALKVCRKDRKKSKRVACERQARRKYGPHKSASR
jgi:hypothetical protein